MFYNIKVWQSKNLRFKNKDLSCSSLFIVRNCCVGHGPHFLNLYFVLVKEATVGQLRVDFHRSREIWWGFSGVAAQTHSRTQVSTEGRYKFYNTDKHCIKVWVDIGWGCEFFSSYVFIAYSLMKRSVICSCILLTSSSEPLIFLQTSPRRDNTKILKLHINL